MLLQGNQERNLLDFVVGLRRLTSTNLTTEELFHQRSNTFKQLPITVWGKVVDRLLTKEEYTLYGLYNATTNVLWNNSAISSQDFKVNRNITDLLLQPTLAV